ncbi:MAG: hemolysin family protein [Pseudomonadota bacterium]
MTSDTQGANREAPAPEEPSSRGPFAWLFGAKQEQPADADGTSHTIHSLRSVRVDDVAVPRADIVAIDMGAPLSAMIKTFKDSGYSRLPVYEDSLDNPLGLVHLKDLALKYGFNGSKATKPTIKRLIRPLIFAPPSMPVSVLLQRMQSERTHMALVIDEYGGVDGLVTIEDLVELVVGEIADEHDVDEDHSWSQREDGSFQVQARADLKEFEQVLGVDLADDTDDEEIDTLGGLVFMMVGRVPGRGEVIRHPKGFDFEIADADARRIKRVIVRRRKAKLAAE